MKFGNATASEINGRTEPCAVAAFDFQRNIVMFPRKRLLLSSLLAAGMSCAPIHAAEVATSDAAGAWRMTISPRGEAESARPIQLAAYEQATDELLVPTPIELEQTGTTAPAESVLQLPSPEAVAENAASNPAAAPVAADQLPMTDCGTTAAIDPAAYWAIYRTIPFIRTEYLANPSYRHETTMELLFGQLRPTVVHKQQAVAPQVPVFAPPAVPPYVYDRHLGSIPTFRYRYRLPMVPIGY